MINTRAPDGAKKQIWRFKDFHKEYRPVECAVQTFGYYIYTYILNYSLKV